MACRLYNTERCLQLQLFNRPNFGVHFNTVTRLSEPKKGINIINGQKVVMK